MLKRLITPVQLAKGKNLIKPSCVNDKEDDNDAFFFEQVFSGAYDKDIQVGLECYLNLPDNENPEQNPLSFHHIRKHQQANAKLLAVKQKFPQSYMYKCLDNDVKDILCYVKGFRDPMTQWRIALLEFMLNKTMNWFCQVLGHPCSDCLRETRFKAKDTVYYWKGKCKQHQGQG
eukprot:15365549-Ditylum_brightwellii.AAC.2